MDLTARVAELEEDLLASEGRFDAIVSETDEGVLVVSPDGVIVMANPAAEFLLSRSSAELAGEQFGSPVVLNETTELNVISADGKIRFIEMRVFKTEWHDVPARLVTLKDVTDQHAKTLRAIAELKQRDQFLAMLSHEIRNPLGAIANASQLLSRMARGQPGSDAASEVVQRQFSHLSRMLDDLLEISRVTQDKLAIQKRHIDCRVIFRDAISSISENATLSTRTIRACIPESPMLIEMDPMRMQQVVFNLLVNAIQYSEIDDAVDLLVAREGDELVFTVADQGVGISEECSEQIFEPFYQVAQPLARTDGGLGIGLTLARKLVSLHGGQLIVHSKGLGSGSTFEVRVPGLQGPEKPVSSATPVVVNASGLKILVIEDSDDIRSMMRMLLECDGHEVIEEGNGTTGLATLQNARPDVAIIDIGLPGLNGFQIASSAKRMPGRDHIRLIALTGYGRPDDRIAALESGFDDHLVKPLQFDVLTDILANCSPRHDEVMN